MSAAEDSERQFAIRESQGPAEVVLKARRAQPFFGRHPWVFAGAVHHVNAGSEQPLQAGSIVRLISAEGHFVAWGLYNPNSRIVVRLYSWDMQQPLDAAFWLCGCSRLFSCGGVCSICRPRTVAVD